MEKKTKNIATIRVKTDLEKPIDIDMVAEHIKSVSDNFQKALSSGMKMEGIVTLLHDSMPAKIKVNKTDIWNVLLYATKLKQHFIK